MEQNTTISLPESFKLRAIEHTDKYTYRQNNRSVNTTKRDELAGKITELIYHQLLSSNVNVIGISDVNLEYCPNGDGGIDITFTLRTTDGAIATKTADVKVSLKLSKDYHVRVNLGSSKNITADIIAAFEMTIDESDPMLNGATEAKYITYEMLKQNKGIKLRYLGSVTKDALELLNLIKYDKPNKYYFFERACLLPLNENFEYSLDELKKKIDDEKHAYTIPNSYDLTSF